MTAPARPAEETIRRLHADFAAQLPQRFAHMQTHYQRAAAGDREQRVLLQRALHSLVGAAGTFGCTELSNQARQLEALASKEPLPVAELFVPALLALADHTGPDAVVSLVEVAALSAVAQHALFYVSATTDAHELVDQLGKFQLPVTVYRSIEELRQPLQSAGTVLAVIIDIGADLPFESTILRSLDAGLLRSHTLIIVSSRREFSRMNAELTAAILDIDQFKAVNDQYGHQVGDTVLKGLTQLLRQRLRKTDLIGRIGGEEFMAAPPETEQTAAWALLDDIRQQFAQINYLGTSGRLYVSFSAGLAPWHAGQPTNAWLSTLDKLLYQAKAAGRNRVVMAAD